MADSVQYMCIVCRYQVEREKKCTCATSLTATKGSVEPGDLHSILCDISLTLVKVFRFENSAKLK